jgi:hypothetical protein
MEHVSVGVGSVLTFLLVYVGFQILRAILSGSGSSVDKAPDEQRVQEYLNKRAKEKATERQRVQEYLSRSAEVF